MAKSFENFRGHFITLGEQCGKNNSDTRGATFLFLPHFDVIVDLLLNRCTATWNLSAKLTAVYHLNLLCTNINFGKISAQPHTLLCVHYFDSNSIYACFF